MKKKLIKIICFVLFGGGIFGVLQNILFPKLYYPATDQDTYRYSGFYDEPDDSIQVLALGTSHILFGYSPNELYEKSGITSYNLGSPMQSLESSYFLLKEALKTQSPEVVVFDVTALFSESVDIAYNQFLVSQMPFSNNKIEFAKEFTSNREISMTEIMFPIIQFHNRWKELEKKDFVDFFRDDHYYIKGYFIDAQINSNDMSVQIMNDDIDYIKTVDKSEKVEYINGVKNIEKIEVDYYNPQISQENMKWLFKMKELCRKEDIELLLVKVPVKDNVFLDNTAWTEYKYEYMKKICNHYDISYYDMMYECDANIAWETDSSDGGGHLNMLGAIKISNILGEYLISNYQLETNYNEEWNIDLEKYQKIREVVLLTTELDFTEYLKKIVRNGQNRTVLIVGQDDVVYGMNDIILDCLKEIGIRTDFEKGFRNSFVAVIENAEVVYEAFSDDKIIYSGKGKGDFEYTIMSSGYYTGKDSYIKINGENYGIGGLGFNIVIYDHEADMVIDSVNFSMHDPEKAIRSNGKTWGRVMRFQEWLMDNNI